MRSLRHGERWAGSVREALSHLDPTDQAEFESHELALIEAAVLVRWDRLMVSRADPYRRILVGSYPPGDPVPDFYYSVQARLLPDMDIELEHLTIDWDHSPPAVE